MAAETQSILPQHAHHSLTFKPKPMSPNADSSAPSPPKPPAFACSTITLVAIVCTAIFFSFAYRVERKANIVHRAPLQLKSNQPPSAESVALQQESENVLPPQPQVKEDAEPALQTETENVSPAQPPVKEDAEHALQPETEQSLPGQQPVKEDAQPETAVPRVEAESATAQVKPQSSDEQSSDLPLCGMWSVTERVQRLGNDTVLKKLTHDVREMMYFPTIDVILHVVPKGGTTAQLLWVYRGLTGEIDLLEWDEDKCKTYIQDFTSPCWQNIGLYIHDLPVEKRREVLSRESTLRVAVQRDPYSRLVSAFKSKFTCERDRFHGDRDLVVDVALLREQGGDHSGKSECMSVDEYGNILDAMRLHVGEPGYVYRFKHIDGHIRPAEFFFEEVDYDLVLDVQHIKDASAVRELYNRLPYKDQLETSVPMVHTSSKSELKIPDEARRKLRAFADVTRVEPLRVCRKTTPAAALD